MILIIAQSKEAKKQQIKLVLKASENQRASTNVASLHFGFLDVHSIKLQPHTTCTAIFSLVCGKLRQYLWKIPEGLVLKSKVLKAFCLVPGVDVARLFGSPGHDDNI